MVVHLVHPSEKLWGRLAELGVAGVTLRGINLGSFDEWRLEAARGEATTLGPVTMFVPLHRVERIFLDEAVGEVESYRGRLEKALGRAVEGLLEPQNSRNAR